MMHRALGVLVVLLLAGWQSLMGVVSLDVQTVFDTKISHQMPISAS
jgi:hypothetical protein